MYDLLGKKFGYLTVIECLGSRTIGKKKMIFWKCQCECGNYREVSATSLVTSKRKLSCGCKKYQSLIGNKYNKLTVIDKGELRNHRQFWKCVCECGREIEVRSDSLQNGHTSTCGFCNGQSPPGYIHEEIIGNKYGKLTVVKHVENNKFLCKCDCGGEKIVKYGHLVNGNTSSCGCIRAVEDLTGKKIGKLTILYKNDFLQRGRTSWHCKCDCGNECDKVHSDIMSGNTASCGCLRGWFLRSRKIDLSGKKYEHFTVVKQEGIKNKRIIWLCKCECGNEFTATYNDIAYGHTNSCGCLYKNLAWKGSKEENEIKDYLLSINPELTITKVRILNGYEIDMYIEELNIGIEYNGSAYHASKNNVYVDKPTNYHYKKYLIAKEKGIRLINIYDVDWWNNKEKIKRFLQYELKPKIKINNYIIKEVNNYKQFIEENSMYKYNAKKVYGFYSNGNLVGIIGYKNGIAEFLVEKLGYEIDFHGIVKINADISRFIDYDLVSYHKHFYKEGRFVVYRCGKLIISL